MRVLFALLIFLISCAEAQAQYTYFTAALPHDITNPSATPSQSGSRIRIDQPTRRLWVWNETTLAWVKLGQGFDVSIGCAAPAYTPIVGQSDLAINTCTPIPELYHYSGVGTVWNCMNCGAGSTVATDQTLAGDGSIGDPLQIAQQGANTSQVLQWTGTTWEPSWGSPYVFVTSGATITTDVNTVLIGTIVADITLGLPVCNAANDQKVFEFKKNGSDNFGVIVDPSGAETFADGAATKKIYSTLNLNCVCRFSGTGTWFFTMN